jgi:hypothetical protein
LPKIDDYGHWSVSKVFQTDTLVTTNQREGFNSLLKSLQGWKEVPLDGILLSLNMLQRYYTNEIKRGKAGIGTYTLKEGFEEMVIKPEHLVIESCVASTKITETIQKKNFPFREFSSEACLQQC